MLGALFSPVGRWFLGLSLVIFTVAVTWAHGYYKGYGHADREHEILELRSALAAKQQDLDAQREAVATADALALENRKAAEEAQDVITEFKRRLAEQPPVAEQPNPTPATVCRTGADGVRAARRVLDGAKATGGGPTAAAR